MWNFGYFKTLTAITIILCLLQSCQKAFDGELIYHKPQPEKGYYYPYILKFSIH